MRCVTRGPLFIAMFGVLVLSACPSAPIAATPRGGVAQADTPVGERGVIAFTTRRHGDSGIFVIDAGGNHLRRLTRDRIGLTTTLTRSPDWSPSGRHLAYSGGTLHHRDIRVMRADGTDRRTLTHTPSGMTAESPDWSRDGRIAYTIADDQTSQVAVIDARGGTPVVVADDAADPSWSPDAQSLAVTVGPAASKGLCCDIAVIREGERRILTNGPVPSYSPAWSPDGRRIAFVRNQPWESPQIFVMRADGTHVRQVTGARTLIGRDPAWSPDSRQLAFVGLRQEFTTLFVMRADGTHVSRLTHRRQHDAAPTWRSH